MSERHSQQPASPVDTHCCPLCGADNRCAQASAGDPGVQCWCMELVIDPASLAQIPESLRGKACLCRACAQRSEQKRP